MAKKIKKERDQSENNFKQALNRMHQTTRAGEGKTFLTESPDARSQQSKQGKQGFFGSR